MINCKKCEQTAVIELPNYGAFCSEHFFELIRNRVKRTIQKYKMISPYERVAVAVSGGKDSTVLLHVLDSLYAETLELIGLHVDLGIAPSEYSKKSLQLAKELCQKLKRDFFCVDLKKEYQISMDLVKDRENRLARPRCAICGTFKRYLLNRKAVELNCEKLATGHVLDDEVSTLFMNIAQGNTDQLTRVGALLPSSNPIVITRIKPLYEISEIETTAYAHLANFSIQEEVCPYSKGASTLKYKKMLYSMESQMHGISYRLLQNYHRKLLPPLQNYYQGTRDNFKKCSECNGPTNEEICAFCNVKKILTANE